MERIATDRVPSAGHPIGGWVIFFSQKTVSIMVLTVGSTAHFAKNN